MTDARMDAALVGLKHYRPERPCRRCGTQLRYTCNGACVRCRVQQSRAYAEKLRQARQAAKGLDNSPEQ